MAERQVDSTAARWEERWAVKKVGKKADLKVAARVAAWGGLKDEEKEEKQVAKMDFLSVAG